jgi:hypothetical protein
MQLSQFEYTLKLGLGRPLVYLHTHDATPYHDVILDACLRNTSYDPQIEGIVSKNPCNPKLREETTRSSW